jgi:hypothetical protein
LSDPIRRRNHYIPASYLAAFTSLGTKAGRLWAYDRRAPGVPKHLAVRDVAVERNLYIRRIDGSPDDSVERLFAEIIEGPFVSVRNKLVYGADVGISGSISDLARDERAAVARFAAFQLLRTPVERDATQWLGQVSSRLFMHEQLSAGAPFRRRLEDESEGPLTKAMVNGLQTTFLRTRGVQDGIKDWLPRTLRNAERMVPLVEELEWTLVEAVGNVTFVTCDMPFVCVRRTPSAHDYAMGGAIGEATFEASLALSPRIALLLSRQPISMQLARTNEFMESIRRRTIEYAHRWVYSRDCDPCVGDVLYNSKQPSYYLSIPGRTFGVSHSPKAIVKAILKSGVERAEFRYGVRD